MTVRTTSKTVVLGPLDAPLALAADLHRRQIAVADEGIDQTVGHAQLLGNLIERRKRAAMR
jgi:hypothetical protein